ncbi:MAG: LysE family transporter [Anaerolineales bacterium]|jgi:threonine/homoserine/homoserine lactone efflux protein
MIAYILQGIVFGFAAAVQPGPLQAYIILQTLKHGWRRTIVLAIVPLLSDLPIIAVVVFVLAAIPNLWVIALRVIGGAFLIYLAASAVRSVRNAPEETDAMEGAQPRGLLQAVLINLLNPNPYLFWGLVTGPILIVGWQQNPAFGIGLIAAFYLVMIFFNAVIILVVSSARRLNLRLRRLLVILSATGLAVFGVYQLWMGITGLFHG